MDISTPRRTARALSARRRTAARLITASCLALAAVCTSLTPAHAVTIDWVTVGDPGNTADTTGSPNPAGAVADEFRIMKYEWTNLQYVDFLNAVDPDGLNPQGIYSVSMGSNARGGISFTSGNAAGSKYAARTNMGDKPVNYVSWFDAARVANWLHNGGLTYETTGTTASAPQNTGAYTLGTATSGTSFTRNLGATFYIPTEDQWYKAAYYKGDGTNVGYWDYATQSDTAPTAVTSGSTGIGSAGNTGNFANFNLAADWNGQNGNVTTVGTNGGPSAYGAFDMGGNVWEWNETLIGSSRGLRGGHWVISAFYLSSSSGGRDDPSLDYNFIGFRLASPVAVPEPSTWVMGLAGIACAGWGAWRRRKHRRVGRSFIAIASLALVAACLTTSPAHAAVITFGNTGIDSLYTVGSRTEAGYSYQAFGTEWELTPGDRAFGNPGSALTTVFNGTSPLVGDRVDIVSVTPAAQFVFGSVDWRTFSSSYNQDVVVEGFLGASVVGSISLTGDSLNYQTASGFGSAIDLLRIRVTNASGSGMLVDNLVLNPVPEPSTCTMALVGLACCGYSMFRRRKRA